jgi:serine/threonine protein kinase/Flp pilus assembly protein TadD
MTEATIFITALEKPTEAERAAFLEEACAGDERLRSRVAALLRAHAEPDDILDSTRDRFEASGATTPSLSDNEPAGAVVAGRYKLLEAIGEGGMGTVWMAEQREPVKRLVALKLIKPGMDSRAVLARFEAERQALALMDHPNIAKILDGGTTGRKAEGRWMKDEQEIGNRPHSSFIPYPSSFQDRPYFVMELVKGWPLTEYCDARRLSIKDRLDLFVQICSAVQHAHQKGIIHRDLKPGNVLVTEHDGRPVPKVIDFGLAKALSSAGALTDRTLCTAFGTVVGTPLYMAPEQVGSDALDVDTRSDIYALGAILYELLTGTTPLEKQRLKQADWEEVRRVIREQEPPRPSLRLSSSETLPSVAASRQTEPPKLSRLLRGDLDWIVMKALEKDRARRYETAGALARDIERYLHDEPVEASPPSRRYRLRKFARKHRRLIGTAAAFVLLVAAGAGVSTWQAMRARSAERQALFARDNANEQLRQAKRSEARANAVLKFFQDKVLSAGRPKGQEGGLSRDATVREALDRAEPEIATAFAGEPLVEASVRNTLGVSYWYLGDREKALEEQKRAIALRRQELGPDDPETVGAMNDLAIVLNQVGKFADAQKILEEVVAVKRRALGPEDPLTLKSVNNLAIALALQGLLEDAVKLLEETLEIQRRIEGPESITTLRSAYNLAIMRRHLGRWAGARPLFDESLQTLRRVFGPDHQDTLRVVNGLGELLLDQRRPAEARALFEEAIEGQKRVLGPTSEETVLTMINLADAARLQGRLAEARKLAEEADALNHRTLGPEHPQTLFGLTILAGIARDEGRLDDARKGYEQALAALRRTFPARTPEVQRCMADYAWMLAATTGPGYRDPLRAIELAGELIRNSPKIRGAWTTLGVAHYRAGAWNKAIAALEKSETEAPGLFTAANGFFLAMAYWQLGEKEKGRQWYAKANRSLEIASQPAGRELELVRLEASHLLGISGLKLPSKGEN